MVNKSNSIEREKKYKELQEKCLELKDKTTALRESEIIYRTALGMTTHTVTIVDIPNKALCQIFNEGSWSGVQTTMTNAPESIIETGIIHPDDVEAYRQFYREIYSGVPRCVCPLRVLSENNHWFWFTMYSETILDVKGQPLYAVCFSDDLTASREAEMMSKQFVRLAIGNAEFSWEANLTRDIIIREDAKSDTIVEGTSFKSFSKLNEATLNQICKEDSERMRKQFSRESMIQAYYDGKRELREVYRYRLPNTNRLIWMESLTYLLMNKDGDICAIMTAENIDESKKNELRLKKSIQNDPLCNVMKREAFNRLIEADFADNGVGSLFMIDVDHFKNVNDSYGHPFGDKVLIDIAQILKSSLRSADYVCRYGGDEFAIFMKGKHTTDILQSKANTLLTKTQGLSYENGYKATLSIGIAQKKENETLEELYKRSDAALYQSKENGRNTFSISEG